MAFLSRRSSDEPRVDLTPMVDVVFLLLIFFMISTTFIESPGLSIKLPEASAEVIDREPRELKVYLSKEGEIFIDDQPVTLEAFQEILLARQPQAAQTTFLLLADEEARHGRVVSLMDLAKGAGFQKLAIATEPRRDRKR
ncbi:MAG: biopolymer transporter ExbD [Desulfuromonadales bacterium]|nr:biopolymer transporter ExbD [Desulfuromonadales bacterium]